MRKAVRTIIIKNGKLLVIHRNKFGKEYDTLPGGGVEINESLNEALVRELAEETTVQISDPRLVFIDHAGQPYGDQYVFVCNYVSGEPQLRYDSQEKIIHDSGDNLYIPGWMLLEDLHTKPFVSKDLKQHILSALKNGWPVGVIEF